MTFVILVQLPVWPYYGHQNHLIKELGVQEGVLMYNWYRHGLEKDVTKNCL